MITKPQHKKIYDATNVARESVKTALELTVSYDACITGKVLVDILAKLTALQLDIGLKVLQHPVKVGDGLEHCPHCNSTEMREVPDEKGHFLCSKCLRYYTQYKEQVKEFNKETWPMDEVGACDKCSYLPLKEAGENFCQLCITSWDKSGLRPLWEPKG